MLFRRAGSFDGTEKTINGKLIIIPKSEEDKRKVERIADRIEKWLSEED